MKYLKMLLCSGFGLGAIVMSFFASSTAFAAPPKSVPQPTSWCASSTSTIPPSAYDTVCLERTANGQMVPSSALSAQANSGWRACSTRINIYDATTGSVLYGGWLNCGSTPHGGYAGPSMAARSGHEYRAWSDIQLTYLYSSYSWSAYSPWANI